MIDLVEVIGWIGSILYILAYFLLTYKIIQKDKIYYLLNKIAAILIIVISFKKSTLQPIFINTLWLYISYLGYNKFNHEIKFLNKYMMHIISLLFILISLVAMTFYSIELFFDVLAWFSVFAFSSSYFLFSTKKIDEKVFHLYNLMASLSIIPKMYLFDNFQVVILEILWAVFALYAYISSSKDDDYLTFSS